MGLDTFEREREIRRKAKRKGLDVKLDRSDVNRRRWRVVGGGIVGGTGNLAAGLTLDQVEDLLENG
jgi:hypothetical protein